jgi:hypothetical protein
VTVVDQEGGSAMAMTKEETRPVGTVYDLEGTLLEACSCSTPCPCWIGEDPDGGECQAILGYHFDRGVINGVDVSGLEFMSVVFIPGNVLAGNWRIVCYVDDRANDEQFRAIGDAYFGRLGGPLADLAQLVGEVLDVRRAPITHEVRGGVGTLRIGDVVDADMAPYLGPDGSATTLQNTIFSTVPGSPAYVSKASRNDVNLPEFGMVWSFEGRNAIQSDYHIAYSGE